MTKINDASVAFWDQKFKEEKTSWGFEPSDSTICAKDLFIENHIRDILIPGIGYGRNAKEFLTHDIQVTGIEISKIAIELARQETQLNIKIYHGSVTEMPFDNHKFGGIFCYALVHLLSKPQRAKFIKDCYAQLRPGGFMIFTVISTDSPMFGAGRALCKNRYKISKGLSVFFYDRQSIKKEFGSYGLLDYQAIDEPIKTMKNEPPLNCFFIVCKRI